MFLTYQRVVQSSQRSNFKIYLSLQGASQLALVVKNLSANAGDTKDAGLTPGLGRSPRARHRNPLQYSYLENPMDRGACQAIAHGVRKSRTQPCD